VALALVVVMAFAPLTRGRDTSCARGRCPATCPMHAAGKRHPACHAVQGADHADLGGRCCGSRDAGGAVVDTAVLPAPRWLPHTAARLAARRAPIPIDAREAEPPDTPPPRGAARDRANPNPTRRTT
jgi:hypothetical protein